MVYLSDNPQYVIKETNAPISDTEKRLCIYEKNRNSMVLLSRIVGASGFIAIPKYCKYDIRERRVHQTLNLPKCNIQQLVLCRI